jgi:tetrahydromethanopterin S-methyltransferase subunit G
MAANDLASLVVKTELINTGFVGPMRENTRAAQQFQREMGKSAAAGQAGSKSMSRFGVITQQAGYQAQDFAVQVAGGQSAMVAMAQQGSQMLGVFGPAGAIAGAILAVGVLVARISGVGESSKKSAEEVRDLRDAYRELELARGGGKEAELTHKKEDLEESVEAYAKAAEEIEKAKKRLESLKKMMVDFMQAGVSDRGYLDQNEVEPYIAKLSEVKEKIDSVTQEMNSMWNSVSDRAGQAFADMVLTGENAFDQLADIVARSMLEIVTRMAIINPLLNSLFNFSGTSILTAFYGRGAIAGSASGGNFSAGDVKLVGENGPELFTSDRAGTIHQAGATRGMMRGDKSGGDVFNISYSFAAGVTHRELAQMIPALINQTKSSILDARARGASA